MDKAIFAPNASSPFDILISLLGIRFHCNLLILFAILKALEVLNRSSLIEPPDRLKLDANTIKHLRSES